MNWASPSHYYYFYFKIHIFKYVTGKDQSPKLAIPKSSAVVLFRTFAALILKQQLCSR